MSCSKNELPIFDQEFIQLPNSYTAEFQKSKDGMAVPSGFPVTLGGQKRSGQINYTYEIDPEMSTAIEGFHYEILSNNGSVNLETLSGELPIQILDDNINLGENLSIVVRITSSDAAVSPNFAVGEFVFSVNCEFDMRGTYEFRNFDNWTGSEFTGTGEMTFLNNTPGTYVVDDFSFGTWPQELGIDPPTGSLRFVESNCGTFEMSGTDNYGDSWEMTEILESNGVDFTFKYSNTYGDFGTVTLTRTDGNTWPSLCL